MFTFDAKKIEYLIINALSEQGPSTADSLHTYISEKHGKRSLQGIYRSLRKLQEDGIVIKNKKTFSIAIAWLLDAASLIDNLQGSHLTSSSLRELLPTTTKYRSWTFSDLLKMNSFWSHLILALVHHTKTTTLVSYTPHLWYMVLHREHSTQFTAAALKELAAAYTIVGSRSYLDKLASRIMTDAFPRHQFYLASKTESLHKEDQVHIDVVGDYIVEVRMDNTTMAHIETLFSNTDHAEDISTEDILPIYTHEARIKIRIKKDPHKARVYRQRAAQFFLLK